MRISGLQPGGLVHKQQDSSVDLEMTTQSSRIVCDARCLRLDGVRAKHHAGT